MSRKPIINVITEDMVGFVYNYNVACSWTLTGFEVSCTCSTVRSWTFIVLIPLMGQEFCVSVCLDVCAHGSACLCPLHLPYWWYDLKWCSQALCFSSLWLTQVPKDKKTTEEPRTYINIHTYIDKGRKMGGKIWFSLCIWFLLAI